MEKIIFLTIFALYTSIASAQWTSANNGLTSSIIRSLVVDGSNIFAGTVGGVFLSNNNGNSWNAINNGLTSTNVYTIAISGSNMFAGAAGMFLTTNNGSSWTAINNGLTDYGIRSIVINGPNIFVGTASSGVFLSNNNGGLWTAVSNGLPASSHIYSLALSGSSIFAGTSSVYLSSNNGSGWGNSGTGLPTSTTAQSLAISGSNIFASIVGTGGGVFKSINNGATWTMTGLSGGTNVYSLAIIGTYLFAGSLYGTVLVSSTNGSTWTLMNDGLPTNTVITSFAICGTDVFAGTSSSGVWKRPLSEITGIEENNNITDFMFYPNPSNGKFTFLENSGNINSIEICNMLGEIIHNISYSNQQISHEIDLSSYPKGIYLVKLYDGERIHLEKLVIQ